MMDDNEDILTLIKERLAKGEREYGHGIRTGDDTTQWGTNRDSWVEMALEEALDMALYLSAQLIRLEKARGGDPMAFESLSPTLTPPKQMKANGGRLTAIFRRLWK